MTRGTWVLGVATAVAGGGFVIAAVQVTRLRERVKELDRQVGRIERATSGNEGPAGPDAELSGDVQELRNEVRRLHNQLRGLNGAGDDSVTREPATPAAAQDSAKASAVTADPGPAAPAPRKLLTPEVRQFLADAIEDVEAERRRRETDRWTTEHPDQAWGFVTKHIGLDETQTRTVQPVLQEHFRQLDALRAKRRDAAGGDRAAVEAEIVAHRQRTLDTLPAYLSAEQMIKVNQLFQMEERSRGGGAGLRVSETRSMR